jgi:autophagy-related protein 18
MDEKKFQEYKGTVIRVHSVASGKTLQQFRRGSYPANLYSIVFSKDSSFLAVTSDTSMILFLRRTHHLLI